MKVFGVDNINSSDFNVYNFCLWVKSFVDLVSNYSYLISLMVDNGNRNKNNLGIELYNMAFWNIRYI